MKLKKKSGLFLFPVLCSILFISCSTENDIADQEESEWNKNNTITIQFYTGLTNKTLFVSDNYTELVNRLRVNSHRVAVLHHADVFLNTGTTVNATVSVAARAGKVPLFSPELFSDNCIEGSGILIGHTTSKMKTVPFAGGNYISVPTFGTVFIPMTFAFLSLDTEEQIVQGVKIIRENLNSETVLVGTVNKSLYTQLESAFQSDFYRIFVIGNANSASTEVIFVLTLQKWIVRDFTETPICDNKIYGFDIQIEAL